MDISGSSLKVTPPELIGIFGGTFDPVHFGHLRTALELREGLELDQLRLVPSATPPHRQSPQATALQRLAMLRLAVADEPGVIIDERELERVGPSFMVDTLTSLRTAYASSSLVLCLGSDAFAGLSTWHRWRQLFELAHIVVVHRPGWSIAQLESPELSEELGGRLVDEIGVLRQRLSGAVLFHRVTPLDISATVIREQIRRGRSARYLLPDAVWRYIRDQELYGLIDDGLYE